MSSLSPIDPLSSVVTLQQDAIQQRAGIAVLKQQHEAEQTLVDMLDAAAQTVEAAPAPGTGRLVDIRA